MLGRMRDWNELLMALSFCLGIAFLTEGGAAVKFQLIGNPKVAEFKTVVGPNYSFEYPIFEKGPEIIVDDLDSKKNPEIRWIKLSVNIGKGIFFGLTMTTPTRNPNGVPYLILKKHDEVRFQMGEQSGQ